MATTDKHGTTFRSKAGWNAHKTGATKTPHTPPLKKSTTIPPSFKKFFKDSDTQ